MVQLCSFCYIEYFEYKVSLCLAQKHESLTLIFSRRHLLTKTINTDISANNSRLTSSFIRLAAVSDGFDDSSALRLAVTGFVVGPEGIITIVRVGFHSSI